MVDLTSIIDEADSQVDFFNSIYVVGLTFIISLSFILYGFQTNNLGLLVTGIPFAFLTIIGVVVTEGRLLTSPASIFTASLAFWIPKLLFNLSTLLADLQFTLLATPSDSYLNTALSSASTPVRYMANGILAPGGESIGLLGFGALLTIIFLRYLKNPVLAVAAASAPIAAIFAVLHGVRSPSFTAAAFIFMFVSAFVLYGSDLSIGFPGSAVILVTFGAMVGLHQGINIQSMGGLLHFYNTILSAAKPIWYMSVLFMVLEAVTFIFAVIGAIRLFDGLR